VVELNSGRFVVTGGASLIGSHIVEQLLQHEVGEIIILDNLSLGSEKQLSRLLVDNRVRFVHGDILRLDELLQHFQGVAGVFHVAGYLTLPMSQDLRRGIEVNVMGTQNVLDASRWAGVKRVILSSSVGVFGNSKGLVSENSPFVRDGGFSPAAAIYGATKIIGEHLGQIYSERHGVDVLSLRYASVYGVRQHERGINARLLIDPLDRIRKGLRPVIRGDGSEVHDYVNALDVASANIAAMKAAVRSGNYTIGTGQAVSVREVVDILLELFGSSLEPEYSNEGRGLTSSVTSSLSFDVSGAKRDLDWQAKVDIKKGLALLKDWREAQDAGREV
jgi:UDP-glucose 4-epimerase